MSNVNTCFKSEKSGNIITCKGKLFFAKFLYTPQENQQGKMKYSLDLCVPPNSDLKTLKNEMGKIALENLDGDVARAKQFVEKRFINPNNKPSGGKPAGPEFEGWVSVRASSDTMPDFIFPNKQKCPRERFAEEVYSGRWARATLNPYWSPNPKNPGVFLGLVNIQLLDHDDQIGFTKPGGDEEFDAVDVDTGTPVDNSTSATDSKVDALFG